MLKIAMQTGSLIMTGVVLGVLIEFIMKRQTKAFTDRVDDMENRLMAINVELGYGLNKLATVDHLEEVKKDLKKQVSCKPKRKKRRGRK